MAGMPANWRSLIFSVSVYLLKLLVRLWNYVTCYWKSVYTLAITTQPWNYYTSVWESLLEQMCLKHHLESVHRWGISRFLWANVPKYWGCHTKSPLSTSGQMCIKNGQLILGSRAKTPCRMAPCFAHKSLHIRTFTNTCFNPLCDFTQIFNAQKIFPCTDWCIFN